MTNVYAGATGAAVGHNHADFVDLRSDTVTRPTPGMLAAMAGAEVGDDVYGDDPTAIALEQKVAETFGKEAGLFLPTGTQSNFCALLAHCGRGEEVLVGRAYHVYSYEAKGASVLGGIGLEPLDVAADNGLEPETVARAVKGNDPHLPITRLLSLENTVSGKAVPLTRQEAAAAAARDVGLSVHLDGARAFNAAIALGIDPKTLARCADSVSVCLSKGLGTPAGSVLCGPKSLIQKAHRYRKMLGGGMRQVGILAAAGLYALEHHAPNLAQDHQRAEQLRLALSELPGLSVDLSPLQTNMVLLQTHDVDAASLVVALKAHGIIASGAGKNMRLVVHRDINDDGIDRVIAGFRASL
ncbi:MAG TPA: low-specificity L-threonine aldolase [Rhodospirillaceae bacterium]|nr:low-specificity L-threonine aldolase [Rhodospirillaceae bacterium]